MKYRIKIITYKSGRQEFYPQVKKGLFWLTIFCYGETSILGYGLFQNSRSEALENIDLHLAGNKSISSIGFEYINK